MTEAMSRREIEDVLTSIKRLVSQDVPSRAVSAEPHHVPAAEAQSQPDKLILTAELRVAEGTQALTSLNESADVSSPLENQSDTAAPGHLAEAPKDSPLQADAKTTQGVNSAVTLLHEGARPVAPSLIQRIATAGGPPNLGKKEGPGVGEVPQSSAAMVGKSNELTSDMIEDAALEQTLARLEAVLSGKPMARPAASTDADATSPFPADPVSAFPGQPNTKSVSDDNEQSEQIIDEGILYQLVAQIVRQELQGELGEKITRNIRKLVRQEVARELQLRRS